MERKTQNQSQRNWTRRKPRPRRKNSGPAQAGDVLSALLASLGGGPERARLSLLWQNWEPVMGPELAPLALPLGRHKDILLIGAEDAMLMQELHLMSGEILERVNAFMESPFFSSIKVSLVLNKTVLRTAESRPAPEARARPDVPPPRPSGSFLSKMDPASPVARCYARFAGKRAARSASRKNAID